MAEPLKKEKQETETLEEWYSKVYDYDPSYEEVNACYDDEFNQWCKDFFKNKK